MDTLQLHATQRTEKSNATRTAGAIPAVLYGHGIAAVSLTLPYTAFVQTYRAAGESTLVDVHVGEGVMQKVLIHDVQRDPVTERFLHVDLYAVRMTEKMKTKVPLQLVGESLAVKQKGGILVKNLDTVHVECLPQDLVHAIMVDLSGLVEFGHSIYVKDIVAPKGITILDKPTEPAVTVMRPKSEEELAKELAVETTEVKVEDAVKVQEKGKKEEEGEEGAGKEGEKSAKGAAPAGKQGASPAGKPQAKDAKKKA